MAESTSEMPPDEDSRPAIVRDVESWNRILHGNMPPGHHTALRPSSQTVRYRRRIDAAARRAPYVYPGPAGELIQRELLAALDLCCRLDVGHHDALLSRLADQILAPTPTGAHPAQAS